MPLSISLSKLGMISLPCNYRMGKSLNIVWSVLTALLTLLTTSLMGVAIMTSHWEVISYSQSVVENLLSVDSKNKTSVTPLLNGRVIVVSKENQENELLVKMHAGLWATCYDLTGMYCNFIFL